MNKRQAKKYEKHKLYVQFIDEKPLYMGQKSHEMYHMMRQLNNKYKQCKRRARFNRKEKQREK